MLREALYEGLLGIKSVYTRKRAVREDYTSDGTTFSFTIKKRASSSGRVQADGNDVAESLKTVLENEKFAVPQRRLTEFPRSKR